MYTREEARALVEKVIDIAAPDAAEVSLSAGERAGTRWANSSITVNLVQFDRQISVTVRRGQRTGSASTMEFSDEGLGSMVREAREAADASEREEQLDELLGPQEYIPVDAALPDMVDFGPGGRAELVRQSLDVTDRKGVVGYGYIPKSDRTTCRANSAGLFAYFREAETSFTLTCRTPDGRGSGWAGTTGIKDLGMIDARELTERAADKALLSVNARPLEPGRYSVILEPRANARFLQRMTGIFGGGGGGGFLSNYERGQRVFSELFTLRSDIGNPVLRQTPIRPNNLSAAPVTWVENGILRNHGSGQPASVNMSLVMEGSDRTVDDLVADTRRGLLVTFFWYIRAVPATEQPLLNTGMTRDGLFLVENGEVTGAVQNFRWNMSPIVGYNNLTAVGRPEPMHMGESYDGGNTALIPPVRIEEFNMSSSSPAVE
jgi:predicted Zn-dependent protease